MGEDAHPTWTGALEKVIKREAEEAEALHWLHHHASLWCGRRNDMLQIPGIIIASATGFLSATSELLPPVAVGALSLGVGVLGTLNSYFKYSQRAEAHRMIAQMYLKVYKNIQTELALPPKQRTGAESLLADLRDRLAPISETAPPLPEASVKAFQAKFKELKSAVPIVANGIDPVEIYSGPAEPSPTPPPFQLAEPRPVIRIAV